MSVFVLLSLLPLSSLSATIYCFIHTATPSHETRAATVAETWAKRCNDYLFFTDSPMNSEWNHVVFPGLTTRDHSWEKIRKIVDILATSKTTFDWYVRADDDTYIVVENLRAFLRQFNSSEDHYLGYKWNYAASHGYADGGAYVLSHPALLKLARVMRDPHKCPSFRVAEEDQEGKSYFVGKCLNAIGIYPKDTRDSYGSDRFQHYHPSQHLKIYQEPMVRGNGYFEALKGVENFSPQMISFHHVSPFEMQMIDYMLYTLDHNGGGNSTFH